MLSDEYYIKRASELINDVYSIKLLYMIGGYNELSNTTVDKDKKKLYFREMIIKYLKNETEE